MDPDASSSNLSHPSTFETSTAANLATLQAQLNALGLSFASLQASSSASSSSTSDIRIERLRPALPGKFDGLTTKDNDALSNFEFDLYSYFKLCNVTNEQQRLDFATTLLVGPAKTCWRAHVLGTTVNGGPTPARVDTFHKLIHELLAPEFQNSNFLRIARDDLARCKQADGTAVAYVHRFRRICLLITDLSDSERLDRFLRGLNHRLRLELAIHPPRDFDDACAIIERMESCDFSVRSSRVDYGPLASSSSYSHGPSPMDLSSLMQRAPANRDKASRGKDSRRPAPQRPSNSRSNAPPTASANRPVFTKLTDAERERLRSVDACLYCRTPHAGHVAADCPHKVGPSRVSPNAQRGPN